MIDRPGTSDIPKLSRIETQSVHQRVYKDIRHVLMKGGFAPGQKVSSRKLGAELGTSDMPVRAALGRLLAEGALVQHRNGTFSIPRLSLRKFREVMTLRALIEGEAAAQACGNVDREGFQKLHAYSAGLVKAIEENAITDYLDYNQKLKFTIYRYSTSQVLVSMIRILWLQAGPFLRHLNRGLDMMVEANFQDEAIEALAVGNPEAARQAISRDILAGMAFLTIHGEFAPEEPEPETYDDVD
ncbi:GntR family transcriptional regulator [Aureimonas fodinaquatilis]|uniref:GntR family transcriptional regulator n=1 Tax=Aureimonas fodinaquatilis TaxID=2565783 RepID=A0A5B0E449_9HYPH|nr:GntR family transcriptional regulator [Aureimonas fodinaquatilis]KAA0972169.1 GntR family transcriptional regulator [Aureimonas fodinaquatilis]